MYYIRWILAKIFGTSRFELRSSSWTRIRNSHIEKENFCQSCGTTRKLQVHHIIPVSYAPEKELDPDNLITLCKRCHLFVGHLCFWRSFNENVREDAEYWLDRITNRPTKYEDGG